MDTSSNAGSAPLGAPDFRVIPEELMTKFRQEARVLPLFERQIAEYLRKKKCSLVTNDLLRRRWKEFERRDRVSTPRVIRHEDFHFKNCQIVYAPHEPNTNNRRHLSYGPGFDQYGEKPVPCERNVRQTREFYPKPANVARVKNNM